MRPPAVAAAALAPLAIGAAVAVVLVSSGGRRESAALLGQQRAQLAVVAHQLLHVQGAVRGEIAVQRAAWPLIAKGLPARPQARDVRAIDAAATAAHALPQTPFLAEIEELSGPAQRLATLYRSFTLLSARGWRHIASAAAALAASPHSAASKFWAENAGVYIAAIYDGSFDLSLIGEKVKDTYERLGEGAEMGSALTPAEVHALERAYSPQADELRPHEWHALEAKLER